MRLVHRIDPRTVALVLGAVALFFAAQSILTEYLSENVLDSVVNAQIISALDLFSVNAEDTIPTWYATLLLFGASALLALIAYAKRAANERYSLHWLGLAAIFAYLSMDEGAVIHEIVGDYLSDAYAFGGYLRFAWVIAAAPLLALFGLVYLRFLLHLPARTRHLFVLAALIYVGGAIVIEAVSANQYDLADEVTFTYLAIATAEELCEMLGIVVFIYALLAYAAESHYAISFELEGSAAPDDSPAAERPPQAARFSPFSPRTTIALALAFAAALNGALIALAVTQAPTAAQALSATAAERVESILYELAPENVVVTRMVGLFGPGNSAGRRMSATLLELYNEVMVINLMSSGTSYALAADSLRFDRDGVTDILHANGEFQFLIFDTPAVEAIAGAAGGP